MSGYINNFNYKKLELRLTDSEYYDFSLAKDEDVCINCGLDKALDCRIVHYDFDETDIYSTGSTSADTIFSLVTWTGATNTGYTYDTIGLTGIDNGLVTFVKTSADTSNLALLSALTGSTLVIPSGDTRLHLNRVTGMTGNLVYPIEIIDDGSAVGKYAQFCGGFYQGYYKLDGSTYEVLPERYAGSWTAEFWLKKDDGVCTTTGNTLNDQYPENKGIFFYMGTRAENKFWNQFYGLNTGTTSGCTSGATEFCTIPKEMDISILDDESGYTIPLDPPQLIITEVKNQFLIYGRAKTGTTASSLCGHSDSPFGKQTACSFTGDSIFVTSTRQIQKDYRNPFLLFYREGRSFCGNDDPYTGYTVCTYTGASEDITELDWASDVVDNALAFMIKDDGSIGYRLLTVTGECVGDVYMSGCSIEEGFSASGTVQEGEWTYIAIKFQPNTNINNECDLITKKPRKGSLMFYVNAKLKFVVNDFDEFIASRLVEHYKKQLGVPFNISIGGGSLGLLESMTFDGQDPDDLGLCIESNFAGSFIGNISQFRMNNCDLNYCDLQNIYMSEVDRYSTP